MQTFKRIPQEEVNIIGKSDTIRKTINKVVFNRKAGKQFMDTSLSMTIANSLVAFESRE